jgi:pentatricopeptide repeat protein
VDLGHSQPPLLAKHGRTDDLRALADAGDTYAGLMRLFTELGRVEEALDLVRAGGNDWHIFRNLTDRIVELLAGQGRVEEARAVAQARADAGDQDAAAWVARLRSVEGLAD